MKKEISACEKGVRDLEVEKGNLQGQQRSKIEDRIKAIQLRSANLLPVIDKFEQFRGEVASLIRLFSERCGVQEQRTKNVFYLHYYVANILFSENARDFDVRQFLKVYSSTHGEDIVRAVTDISEVNASELDIGLLQDSLKQEFAFDDRTPARNYVARPQRLAPLLQNAPISWVEVVNSSGITYYYNPETCETCRFLPEPPIPPPVLTEQEIPMPSAPPEEEVEGVEAPLEKVGVAEPPHTEAEICVVNERPVFTSWAQFLRACGIGRRDAGAIINTFDRNNISVAQAFELDYKKLVDLAIKRGPRHLILNFLGEEVR